MARTFSLPLGLLPLAPQGAVITEDIDSVVFNVHCLRDNNRRKFHHRAAVMTKGMRVWTLCWPNQIELRLVESGQDPINRLTHPDNELILAVLCECVCERPGSAGLDARTDV